MDASTFSSLLKERLAKSGSCTVGRVLGTCMVPALPHGFRLRLVPLSPGDPRAGTIYVHQVDDRLFVHRCVGVEPGVALFKSDRGVDVDRVAVPDGVVGRVESVLVAGVSIRLDRWPVRALGRLTGLLLPAFRRVPARVRGPLRRWLRRAPRA